ncbi:MAG: cupin domain-containing protein [Gammaproteobacteria bacterium]|nr:cupin domain-containing protein [Gammaproteobacteria bacterium]
MFKPALKIFRKLMYMTFAIVAIASSQTFAQQSGQGIELASQATAPHVYHKQGSTEPLVRDGSLPGERIEVKLNAYQSEGRYTIMDFTFPIGSDSSPGHYHALHSETYIIISGRMEWMVEGEKQILEAGDLIYVPPNTYHSARTLGNEHARTMMIFDPGGFEADVYARNALTEEQKNDPEFMASFFRSIDYHFDPARAHDHDAE